jgi:hypothetical protein
VQGNRQVLVLRTVLNNPASFQDIWVDVERSAAITRWINYSGGRVQAQMDIEYHETREGWMPSGWTINRYEPKGGVDDTTRLQVKEFVMNGGLDISELQLEKAREPGMVVKKDEEQTEKGTDLYIVEANGDLSPLRFGPDGQILRSSQWARFAPWVAVASAMVVLLGAWLLRKHLRKHSTRSQA